MLQSQVINVLPRRILASLWATSETRIAVSYNHPAFSHFLINFASLSLAFAFCCEQRVSYT